jgi:hypothetical protein
MAGRGRPNIYETVIQPKQNEIIAWAKAGATNAEIASALGIGLSTLQDHISKHKDLSDALHTARRSGVPEVKLALYRRAIGYKYTEKKCGTRPNKDGEMVEYVEIVEKEALPALVAIQVFLRNFSDDFRDRAKTDYDFKALELELRKTLAERREF